MAAEGNAPKSPMQAPASLSKRKAPTESSAVDFIKLEAAAFPLTPSHHYFAPESRVDLLDLLNRTNPLDYA